MIGTLPVGPGVEIQLPYIEGTNGGSVVGYYMFRFLSGGEIRNVAPFFPSKVILSAFPSVKVGH